MKLTKKEINLLFKTRWAALEILVKENPKDSKAMFNRVNRIQALLKELHKITKHPPKDLYPDPLSELEGSKSLVLKSLWPDNLVETFVKENPKS